MMKLQTMLLICIASCWFCNCTTTSKNLSRHRVFCPSFFLVSVTSTHFVYLSLFLNPWLSVCSSMFVYRSLSSPPPPFFFSPATVRRIYTHIPTHPLSLSVSLCLSLSLCLSHPSSLCLSSRPLSLCLL